MVSETFDHVVPYGRPAGPQQFLTSDQCAGCHDATGTISDTGRADIPAMLYPNALQTCDPGSNPPTNCKVNVSPNGEWRYSMMGLSGRDPIFLAQLETERTIHPQLSGQPNAADLIDDTCLRCHGVMGERQYKIDTNGGLLTHDYLSDPNSRYGALARDGVSCDSCHKIAADGLGTEETYTGQFKVGPPTETLRSVCSSGYAAHAECDRSQSPVRQSGAVFAAVQFVPHHFSSRVRQEWQPAV